MTGHEEHPREETEEQRFKARRMLRKVAENKLKKYGEKSQIPVVDAVDVPLRLADGSLGLVRRIVAGDLDVVKINLYHTEDPLGPLTQYSSWSPGEFTRADLDPRVSSGIAEEDVDKENPVSILADAAITSMFGAMAQMENESAGIDGFPVTAQEARNVAKQVRDARVAYG